MKETYGGTQMMVIYMFTIQMFGPVRMQDHKDRKAVLGPQGLLVLEALKATPVILGLVGM
jgi:hypothetical protein